MPYLGKPEGVEVTISFDPRPEFKKYPYILEMTELRRPARGTGYCDEDEKVGRYRYMALADRLRLIEGYKGKTRHKTLEKALKHKHKVMLSRELAVADRMDSSNLIETVVWKDNG